MSKIFTVWGEQRARVTPGHHRFVGQIRGRSDLTFEEMIGA